MPTTAVSRETYSRIEEFEGMVLAEAQKQNLIAASTRDQIASRHTDDSRQLLALMPATAKTVVDIGSGAGFPGMIFALMTDLRITMVEPRALRAAFLHRAAEVLELTNAIVIPCRAELVNQKGGFDVITARAVATLDRMFRMSRHLAHPDTVWLLPKGRSVHTELAAARRSWQGEFEVRPSLTSADAGIVIARNVRPRRAT